MLAYLKNKFPLIFNQSRIYDTVYCVFHIQRHNPTPIPEIEGGLNFDYDDSWLMGIFTSHEKAKEFIDLQWKSKYCKLISKETYKHIISRHEKLHKDANYIDDFVIFSVVLDSQSNFKFGTPYPEELKNYV